MGTEAQHNIEVMIRDTLAGNRDAFRNIVSTFQGKVYSTALKATGDYKEAEDLTQDIFLQAYKSLGKFRFESSFSTWLYRIAMHKAIDWKRKNFKQPIYEQFDQQLDIAENKYTQKLTSGIDDYLVKKEAIEQMKLIVDKLPDRYRDVVEMYHYQNKSYAEIASELQLPVKTVETRLYRAKQKLKEQAEKEEYA